MMSYSIGDKCVHKRFNSGHSVGSNRFCNPFMGWPNSIFNHRNTRYWLLLNYRSHNPLWRCSFDFSRPKMEYAFHDCTNDCSHHAPSPGRPDLRRCKSLTNHIRQYQVTAYESKIQGSLFRYVCVTAQDQVRYFVLGHTLQLHYFHPHQA